MASQQQQQEQQHEQENITYSSSSLQSPPILKRTIEDVEMELISYEDQIFELKKYVYLKIKNNNNNKIILIY